MRVFPPGDNSGSERVLDVSHFPTDLELKPEYGYVRTTYIKDHRSFYPHEPKRDFTRDVVSSVAMYTSLEFPE